VAKGKFAMRMARWTDQRTVIFAKQKSRNVLLAARRSLYKGYQTAWLIGNPHQSSYCKITNCAAPCAC
jgi:hypothetical protein